MRKLAWLYAIVVGARHAWWLNTHRGPWPVSRFGAIIDGVTDDTRAIQRAIDVSRTHGGAVLLGPGTHRVRGRLRA
jgi:polygalacturonase